MASFFINPVFLAGCAAASLPIVIHLLTRRRYKRVRWAAMEFLLRAYKKTHRRLRLENILVLLLRVAAVALFAVALARPVLHQTAVLAELGEKNRCVFLVVDSSYSMGLQRGEATPFDKAKRIASDVLATLEPGSDSASLILASSMPEAVFEEPTPDVEKVREELGNLGPSAGVTDWRPALTRVLEVLANPQIKNAPNKSVYIITDMQRHAWLAAGAPAADESNLSALLGRLAESVDAVNVIDVGFDATDNTAVSSFTADDKIIGLDKPASFTVTVDNFAGVRAEDLNVEFFVDGAPRGNQVVSADPRSSASASFTTIFRTPGPHSLKVQLTADSLPVDNERHLAVNVREVLDVLLVDGEPLEEGKTGFFSAETAFLKIALMPADELDTTGKASIIQPVVRKYFELGPDTFFGRYQVVILANEGRKVTSEFEVVEALEAYVRAGGALLIFLGDRIKAADYNRSLFRETEGILPLRLEEIRGDANTLQALVPATFRHPVFSVFDDPDLRKIVVEPSTTFWFGVSEEEKADSVRVIARFDDEDGSPAVVEKTLGHGRVILVTTTCDDEWSMIPRSFVFLPLVHEMVYYLAHEGWGDRNVPVGGLLRKTLTQQEYSENVTMVLPSGGKPTVEPPRRAGHGRFSITFGPVDQVGVYELQVEGEKSLRELFAANLNTRESDLGRISEEELRLLWPASARSKLSFAGSSDGSAEEKVAGGAEFWRHLLVVVIVLLALETILAQRFGNYAR